MPDNKRRRAQSVIFFATPLVIGSLTAAAVVLHQPVEIDASVYDPANFAELTNLQTRDLPADRGGIATLELTLPELAREGRLVDGVYTGAALCGKGNDEDWKPYYLLVDIEVRNGRVVGIANVYGDKDRVIDPAYWYDAAENSMYLNRAIRGTGGRFTKGAVPQINEFVASGEETGGVDTVSGSTYSVVSIFQAFNRAVDEAVAASS